MKKIFTLAAILISLSIASFAADRPKKGKISVTSNTNATVFVKIDGQKYNLDRNEFVMNSINAGNHRVEIYQIEKGGFFGRMRTRVIYSDFINVAPDQSVSLNVNRMGNVMVKKSGFDPYGRDDRWGNDRDHDSDHGYGRNDDRDHGRKW
jgi:hypothetical protein